VFPEIPLAYALAFSLSKLHTDQAPLRGNPTYFGCHMDEDMIGRIKSSIVQHAHAATYGLRALEYYATSGLEAIQNFVRGRSSKDHKPYHLDFQTKNFRGHGELNHDTALCFLVLIIALGAWEVG